MEGNGEELKLPEIEEEPESKIKKVFKIILAFFLLLLVIPYFLSGYGVGDVVRGLIESSTFDEENIIQINKESKLIFMDETKTELDNIYESNKGKEFKVCLMGEKTGLDYSVSSIFGPRIYSQTHNQVVSDPCPIETIVSLHSHPEKKCLPSQQDIRNFNLLKERNPNAILAVMCEKDRLNFYS